MLLLKTDILLTSLIQAAFRPWFVSAVFSLWWNTDFATQMWIFNTHMNYSVDCKWLQKSFVLFARDVLVEVLSATHLQSAYRRSAVRRTLSVFTCDLLLVKEHRWNKWRTLLVHYYVNNLLSCVKDMHLFLCVY